MSGDDAMDIDMAKSIEDEEDTDCVYLRIKLYTILHIGLLIVIASTILLHRTIPPPIGLLSLHTSHLL